MFRENVYGTGPLLVTARNIETTHAFTTRLGGESAGIYRSLNLGENRGDDPNKVRENYRLLWGALRITTLPVFSRQVHGCVVRPVTSADRHELFSPIPYEADGLITDEEDLPLVIFTADCIPILLHDPVRRAIGAVHAGWRGTAADIAGEAIRKMTEVYGCRPEDTQAAIGPGIGKCCFETGPEVPEAMLSLSPDLSSAISPGCMPGKYMVDLKKINSLLLIRAGVPAENIAVSPECTKCLNDKYWSHRHTGGVRGSQASVIMLKG